jgi:hypothetical protein
MYEGLEGGIKMKLTKYEVLMVQEWLQTKSYGNCPFDGYCWKEGETCKIIFPKLKKTTGDEVSHRYNCPCEQYSDSSVVKKAGALVKKYLIGSF